MYMIVKACLSRPYSYIMPLKLLVKIYGLSSMIELCMSELALAKHTRTHGATTQTIQSSDHGSRSQPPSANHLTNHSAC